MTESLWKVPVEIYNVKYTPSVRASLFGPGSEMSTTVVEDLVGPACRRSSGKMETIGDIRSGVLDALRAADREDLKRKKLLLQVLRRVSEILSNPTRCPVCLEEFTPESSATVLSPCWHFACRFCMERLLVTRRWSVPSAGLPLRALPAGYLLHELLPPKFW